MSNGHLLKQWKTKQSQKYSYLTQKDNMKKVEVFFEHPLWEVCGNITHIENKLFSLNNRKMSPELGKTQSRLIYQFNYFFIIEWYGWMGWIVKMQHKLRMAMSKYYISIPLIIVIYVTKRTTTTMCVVYPPISWRSFLINCFGVSGVARGRDY